MAFTNRDLRIKLQSYRKDHQKRDNDIEAILTDLKSALLVPVTVTPNDLRLRIIKVKKKAALDNNNKRPIKKYEKFWNSQVFPDNDKPRELKFGPVAQITALNEGQAKLERERKKLQDVIKELENTRKELYEASLNIKISEDNCKVKDAEIENLKKVIKVTNQEKGDLKVKLHELEDLNSELIKEKKALSQRVNKYKNSVKAKYVENLQQKVADLKSESQQKLSELKLENLSKSRQIGGLKRALQRYGEGAVNNSIDPLLEPPKELYDVRNTVESEMVQIPKEKITPINCYVGNVQRSSLIGSVDVEETVGLIKSSHNQTYLSLNPKTKDRRIQQVEYIISNLSGGDKYSDDYKEFYRDLLIHNYDLTNEIVEEKKFKTNGENLYGLDHFEVMNDFEKDDEMEDFNVDYQVDDDILDNFDEENDSYDN